MTASLNFEAFGGFDMTKRSPAAVLLLPFVTFFIYWLYWLFATAGEMKAKGAEIPSAILAFIPIANFIYLWKWSKGVEHVTNGSMSGGTAFILLFLLGNIGGAVIQSKLNDVA